MTNESQMDNEESKALLKTLIYSYEILEEKLLKINIKIDKLMLDIKR